MIRISGRTNFRSSVTNKAVCLVCRSKVVDDIDGGAVEHPVVVDAGMVAKGNGQMGLAHTGGADINNDAAWR